MVEDKTEQPANDHEAASFPTQAEPPAVEPSPPPAESAKISEPAATPMETAAVSVVSDPVPTLLEPSTPAISGEMTTDSPAPAAVETTASEVEYAVAAPAATDRETTVAPDTEDAAALSAETSEPSPPALDMMIPVATTTEGTPATSSGAVAAEFEPESLATTTPAETTLSLPEHDPIATMPYQEDTISVEVESEVMVATLAVLDDTGQAKPAPDEAQSAGSADSPQTESDVDQKPAS